MESKLGINTHRHRVIIEQRGFLFNRRKIKSNVVVYLVRISSSIKLKFIRIIILT